MAKTVDKDLENGDSIAIGHIRAYDITDRGSGINLLAVTDDSDGRREFVLLSKRFTHDDHLTLPQGSTVLHVAEGEGVAGPICWFLTPKSRWSE